MNRGQVPRSPEPGNSVGLFGIRAKAILLALLCAIVPSVLVSVIAINTSRKALEDAVKAEVSDLALHQKEQLLSWLESTETDLGTWSALHAMQNVLTDDEDGTIAGELSRLKQRYPRFGDILVVNPSGIVVASATDGNKGKIAADSDFFAPAIGGHSYRGAVKRQEFIGRTGLALATPIRADYDPETVVGILVGIVDWSAVQSALDSVTIWGERQDAGRRLILRTTLGEILFGNSQATENATASLPSNSGVEQATVFGSPFLIGTEFMSPAGDGPGWLIHAMIDPRVAYAGVKDLQNRILVISAIIIALAMVLGAFLSGHSIVRPIKMVTAAMRKVSAGEATVDLKGQHRRDEIGQMLTAISIFRDKLEHDTVLIRESEQALRLQITRFDAALSNMSQGLSMFDRRGTLIVANRQFAELYGLFPSLIEPGITLGQILEHRVASASYLKSEVEKYECDAVENARAGKPWDQVLDLPDGRVISVSHRPMVDGGWVSTHADITEQRRADAQIAHMARHDALTGLPNRTFFRSRIEEVLRHVARDQTVAVLCLDLDRFKNVNDTLGHPIGDALLREVADRLRRSVRDTDTIARLGGDEFAIVQADGEQPSAATALAQRIIDALGVPYEIEDHHIVIGASVGIALAPMDGNDPDRLLKNADLALYRGKADGGGAYRFFEPEMDARMQARQALESDLRKALAREEFEVFYQPLVNILSAKIIGFEALVRWHHPNRGIINPDEFISVAEESGLIVPLGKWVLRRACTDAAAWPENIRLSVNLSPVQFQDRDLVGTVFAALAFSHLSATRLDLEITETVLLRDSEATLAVLRRLRAMGVQISMDDFGTGYSSLSYLQKFPFSKIKIDQSFINNLSDDEQSIAIVRAVTGLSRSLGMITTAEGVENAEQLERLRSEGCTEIQGYYVSPPRPFAEATALLRFGTKSVAIAG